MTTQTASVLDRPPPITELSRPCHQLPVTSQRRVDAQRRHHLARWSARIGGLGDRIIETGTFRRRYLRPAGRITRSGGKNTLHLPPRWPWADQFMAAIARIRSIVLVI